MGELYTPLHHYAFMGELEHLPFTIELPSKIKLGLFLLHDVALLHGRTSSMMSELELPSKKNRRASHTMTIPLWVSWSSVPCLHDKAKPPPP
jgi:hypothetical protein